VINLGGTPNQRNVRLIVETTPLPHRFKAFLTTVKKEDYGRSMGARRRITKLTGDVKVRDSIFTDIGKFGRVNLIRAEGADST